MNLATVKVSEIGYALKTKNLIGQSFRANPSIEKFGIEYQPYLDRFEGIYSGVMYNFFGNHMDILVTPNHRMLFRPIEKNTDKKGEFILEEATFLPNSFDFLRTVTPKTKRYKNPKETLTLPIKLSQYLCLMGWYLSDGTMSLRGKKIKSLRISQKKGGKLCWFLTHFFNQVKSKITCSLYCY